MTGSEASIDLAKPLAEFTEDVVKPLAGFPEDLARAFGQVS